MSIYTFVPTHNNSSSLREGTRFLISCHRADIFKKGGFITPSSTFDVGLNTITPNWKRKRTDDPFARIKAL